MDIRWKHAEVRREAVAYMKAKYNMDVAEALWQKLYAVVPNLAAAPWEVESYSLGAGTRSRRKAALEPGASARRWCCLCLR
ncbi:hypothetical protein WJ0W_003834 [Paenibacillus melissococcoides]|uniref:Uncharacterized protein n=2 Tax=Paenibacillus TaxID=44249 RepID=A0ABM9G4D5_9BACL|nr:hypothetical protein WJ0W_003834 [Paenibacillus melissococcoides]